MWNTPSNEELERMPKLYATEGTPLKDKLIYQHFYIFDYDWYMAEHDADAQLFFGYAILNNNQVSAEWGLIDYQELRELKVPLRYKETGTGITLVDGDVEVDRELDWTVKKASEIERIIKSGGIFNIQCIKWNNY